MRNSAIALLLVACVASAFVVERTVKETAPVYPHPEFKHVAVADGSTETELIFGVRQNLADLDRLLDEVSNPASPKYGQYYSMAQLKELFYDEEATVGVRQWLQNFDLLDSTETPNGEFITVRVTINTANRMLGTEFHTFVHRETGEATHRCREYSLPTEVADYVLFVSATVQFPIIKRGGVFAAVESVPADTATPQVIDKTYGISNNVVNTTKSSNSLFETIGQSFVAKDIPAFDSANSIPAQKISQVVGPNNPSSCSFNPNNCAEASLDVQQITAIAQSTNTTFWAVSGQTSFATWISQVAATSDPPLVHSISYGANEKQISKSQAQSFDNEVAKLGMRGVSVFVASGDDGCAGSGARGNPSNCGFNPSWPATAPHVTAVGATQGPESGTAEVACTSATGGGITSGGGFSTIFDQPSYQSSVVKKYISSAPNMPPASDYNGAGRAYPDVSALGHNYQIFVGGQSFVGSGTSASTPVFAAVITLINANRIAAGKSALGFLNKALYSIDASNFNDITSGRDNCAAGQSGSQTCCPNGFTATAGWDPLSGIGSPKFQKLAAALQALP